MKSKTEIQLELIQEINEICSENNLKYTLFEVDGKNPFHKTKKGKSGLISIAMTQGDIERFSKIIEDNYNQNRYVEGIFNNPKFNPLYVTYGNRNTTDISILNISHAKNYGIQIIIHPINKSSKLDGTKIQGLNSRLNKEKKIRNTLNRRIENPRFWYLKTGMSVLNGAYSLTGGGKRYFKEIMKNISLDNWNEIQDYSEVSINEYDINADDLKEISKISIRGYDIFASSKSCEFFIESLNKKLESDAPMNFKGNKIIDTEIGYEEVIRETGDMIREAKGANEEVAWIKLKVKDEQRTIGNVWRLVEMTNIQVQYINYFKEKNDYLSQLDLNDKNEFNEVYNELKPVITELKKYAKYNLTFSIDNKTDNLIEEVLIRKGEDKFLEKIKALQNKEYLIE